MQKLKSKQNYILIGIFIFASFLRLYDLNWDKGHYLHPDERLYVNASQLSWPQSLAEFFTPQSPLNPHMFYYGSFPLYLYKIIYTLFLQSIDFLIISRLISALFSIATIPLIFLIGKQLFSKAIGIKAAIIFAFAAGTIQAAHFNTTESMLLFFLSLILFLSIKILAEKKYTLFIPVAILLGLSYATKIVGLSFVLIPFVSFLILLYQREFKNFLIWATAFTIIAAITGVLFAPYQIIDFAKFNTEQSYMQGVIQGKYKPPFTIIYEGTIPYVYQLINVLPYTFGFFSLPLALIGIWYTIQYSSHQHKKIIISLFLFLFPLIYFLYAGAWYAKFARYYLLLFPFLAIWAAMALDHMRKYVQIIILTAIILNGSFFLKIYVSEHPRIEASDWMYQNVPSFSVIAGEHWDDALPLPTNNTNKEYLKIELPVYDPENSQKIELLADNLAQSDYFIISSRRVYTSILNNSQQYPLTTNFYNKLFAEQLGYSLANKFTNYPFIIHDDLADESFQSYDHPPVLIFKNKQHYSAKEIKKLILEQN